MPRQPRIDLPGQLYHVIVRGIERRPFFRTDDDRLDFLQRLGSGLLETKSLCLTWALMSNHFHLLLIAGVRGLAALMQPLLTGYVGAFNRRYRRVGHLVQNRYKAILCQKESYLLELIRYIPLNPVRAKRIKTPIEFAQDPWTGHSALLGLVDRPWQATEEVLAYFGLQVSPARQAYESHVLEGWNQGHRTELEGGGLLKSLGGLSEVLQARATGERQAFDSRILGDGHFVESILRGTEQIETRQQKLKKFGLTLERLQLLAANATGVDADALLQHDRRRPVAEARSLWVYSATEILGLRASVLTRLLRMSSGAVSEIRKRGERLAKQYNFIDKLGLKELELSRTVPQGVNSWRVIELSWKEGRRGLS